MQRRLAHKTFGEAIAGSLLVTVAGCTSLPTYGVGTPCETSAQCRAPLECKSGRCALADSYASASGGHVASTSGGASSTSPASGGVAGSIVGSGGTSVASGGVTNPSSAGNDQTGGGSSVTGGASGGLAATNVEASGGTTMTGTLALGQKCSSASDCQTPFCVDGVCCESACNEQCKVCNSSESPGLCVVLHDGQPKGNRLACSDAGTVCDLSCNGSDSCTFPIGKFCDLNPACIDRQTQRLSLVCNDQGQCAGTMGTACEPPQVCNMNIDAKCGLGRFTAVETSQTHTCAVASDGTLYCWGSNDQGQLGWSPSAIGNYLLPQLVPNQKDVRRIATGLRHSCALYANGQIACWGSNNYGQLGCTSLVLNATASNPCRVATRTDTTVIDIQASGDSACVLYSDATVQCWGRNDERQLGNGSSSNTSTPTDVYKLTHAVAISVGVSHACAVIDDGTVKCWGSNGYGQLGDGTQVQRIRPVPVLDSLGASSLTNAVAVSAGSTHTCALLKDGAVVCFGESEQLQMGALGTSFTALPVVVPFAAPAISVVAGIHFTCALIQRAPQVVQCVGWNDLGQLGNDSGSSSATPVLAQIPAGKTFTQLLSKYDDACLLAADGTLWCWGNNGDGQIGNGSYSTIQTTPTQPDSPFTG